MRGWLQDRSERLREFFRLSPDAQLLTPDAAEFVVCPENDELLAHFNIEWHTIPSERAIPFDDDYVARLYPQAPRDFDRPHTHGPSDRRAIAAGHRKHQGRIIGVEITQKPRYLPCGRQFYGTVYGFDPSADPFGPYLAQAGMTNATRYDHNYLSLREFIRIVNEDWRRRGLMPEGYRLTICPPAVFNLVGTVFHPEWSQTETLELGFYRDEQGSATCFCVGPNAPNDFSYVSQVEMESDWALAGFRTILVPE